MLNEFFIERRLLQIGNNLFTRRDGNLKTFDITTSQSEALLFFQSHPNSIVLDFANHMLISHQAARNIVEKLKDKGLLATEIDENDARARKVRLTANGKILQDKLISIAVKEGEKILRGFSDEEKILLANFIERIQNNI